ncbi:MAG: right-handed parallel beta-helix repeat-containing protein [Phycisphaerae bacterium]
MSHTAMMLVTGLLYSIGPSNRGPAGASDRQQTDNPYTLTESSVQGDPVIVNRPQPVARGGAGDCPYSLAPMDVTGGGTTATGGPVDDGALYSLIGSIAWISQSEQSTGGDYTIDSGFHNTSHGPVTCFGSSGIDCNNNFIDDECDIAAGFSLDRDGNCQPDECDDCIGVDLIANACRLDCGAFDGACEVTGCGESIDVDGNGVPDLCDPDCDGDGIPNSVDDPSFRFYVDGDATGAGDGSTWTDAFTDLQDAICAARGLQPYCTPATCKTCSTSPTDINNSVSVEIWVADGIYTPAVSARDDHFRLTTCVALYGGFAGDETERDQRDPQAHTTTLSGDLADDDAQPNGNAENSFHVVDSSPEGQIAQDSSAVLDGFTVTGGNANGNTGGNKVGGGLRTFFASPSVVGCVFENNFALNRGGGVFLTIGSTSTFENCTFRDNSAQLGGGFSSGNGVAARLSRCVFADNTAFIGSLIDSGSGGAFSAQQNSTPVLIDCVFHGNHADRYGGALYNSSSATRLINVTIIHNDADYVGGGIYDVDSHTTVHSSTIAGNHADNADGPVTGGGGIAGQNSNPFIVNSILWGNTAAVAADVESAQISGGSPGIGYTIVEGLDQFDLPVSANFDADPLFADLPGGDVQLMTGSPAIDRGDRYQLPLDPASVHAGVAQPLQHDLAGQPRVAGPELDLGAFELFVCSSTFFLDPDWINFVECVTGPAGEIKNGLCACYDSDADQDVDFNDFATFQIALSP